MKNYVCLIILITAQISFTDNGQLSCSKEVSADTNRMMERAVVFAKQKDLAERKQRENQFSELVNTFFGEPQYLGVSPFTLSLYICLHMMD